MTQDEMDLVLARNRADKAHERADRYLKILREIAAELGEPGAIPERLRRLARETMERANQAPQPPGSICEHEFLLGAWVDRAHKAEAERDALTSPALQLATQAARLQAERARVATERAKLVELEASKLAMSAARHEGTIQAYRTEAESLRAALSDERISVRELRDAIRSCGRSCLSEARNRVVLGDE